MAVNHYENFPVGSWVLPKSLRAPVHALYAFCRTADDIADEGDGDPALRLQQLAALTVELDRIGRNEMPQTGLVQRLNQVAIRPFSLPLPPFYNLLSAFTQDVTTTRFPDEAMLLDYCARSANPVGRLMLGLFGIQDATAQTQSDAICTALQLINFCQDVAIDWQKGRVYLPEQECQRYGITVHDIDAAVLTPDMQALIAHQVMRAQHFLDVGVPLGRTLPGRVGLELRLIVAGGQRILDKLRAAKFDVFTERPKLHAWDAPLLLWRALLK